MKKFIRGSVSVSQQFKNFVLLISGLGLFGLASISHSEDFESFINVRLGQKRLHLPNLLSGGIYKPELIETSTPEFSELLAFYKTKLEIKDGDQFFSEHLAPIFRMPQGRPVRPLYNDFLIWVKRGNKFVYLLRPIDTVTGCDSSCAPIVFHLVMDEKGRVTNLLEEADEPLRKIYHSPMSPEDKIKLLSILKKLPESFRGIDHPDRLTNTFTAFPPQTWTFFAPSVVEGAAYTSYRIYESALQVQQRLQDKDHEVDLLTDLYGKLFRISDLASAQSFIDEITSRSLKKKMGPETASFAVSAFYEILMYLSQENLMTPENLKRLLKSRSGQKNEIQHQCALVRDLFPYPKLTTSAIENATHCPREVRNLYADLINGKYWESSSFQTPPFLLKDEKSFFFFLKKFQDEKKDSLLTKRMTAEATVYFPDESIKQGITKPIAKSDEEIRFQSDAEINYRESIKRKHLNPWTDTAIKGTFSAGSKAAKEMELPASKIIIFFAPWCPHCSKLLHSWGAEKKLDSKLKDHILLIQSFSNDNTWNSAKSFCLEAGLAKNFCNKNLWILEKDSSDSIIKTLGLYTIPRTIITNPKGQVLVFDYNIDLARPLQSNQDLLFLWQEANKDRISN